jgi:glucose-1-phosphate thymidylyltransferase
MNASKNRCGIILAGGLGSRLFPATDIISKQLLPVFDKPMIYYPLATLMLLGIQDIQLISTPEHTPRFRQLLKDGSWLGLNISYAIQKEPNGVGDAINVGARFINSRPCTIVLGDNLFYGYMDGLRRGLSYTEGAVIYGYPVTDPTRFGVVELDETGGICSIEEKPQYPRTNLAIPGIYHYDASACERVKSLRPSANGEIEITSLNQSYLDDGMLHYESLGRGIVWLETGTPLALSEASTLIATIEQRQGLKIGCLEEIALRQGYIDTESMAHTLSGYPQSPYKAYCENILQELQEP